MILLVKLVALVAASNVVTTVHSASSNAQEARKAQLRNAAQNALNDINSKHKLVASTNRAARGQHVFNNGLLDIHYSVLQKLLRNVGGYDEQLRILMKDLIIPLSRTQQKAIGAMVAHFRSGEFYVDYNADVFGEYVGTLRTALVNYLKAYTSVTINERYGIQKLRQRVQFIATQMVKNEVYVDPMARDRYLWEIPSDVKLYNQVKHALRIMFENILQDFQKVADKIHVFRLRNNWNWD